MQEVKSFHVRVGSLKNFVMVTKCARDQYRVAVERTKGKKKETASAVLFESELKSLAKIASMLSVLLFFPFPAFAETATDCKTYESCMDLGDRTAQWNSKWATAAYAKATAIAVRENRPNNTQRMIAKDKQS